MSIESLSPPRHHAYTPVTAQDLMSQWGSWYGTLAQAPAVAALQTKAAA